MKPRRLSLFVLVVCLGLPLPGWSNPIMAGGWISACQVDGTSHVMLSYTCAEPDEGYAMGSCGVSGLSRDGQSVGAQWNISSHTDDLGSGVTGMMYGGTVCDCNVPAGKHAYGASDFNTSITVAEVSAAEGTWCGEPTACAQCSSPAPDSGAPPRADGGTSPATPEPGTPDRTTPDREDGGCAFVGSGRPDLPVLVLLALGLFLARRRD